MNLESLASEHLSKLSLFSGESQSVEVSVSEFVQAWTAMGCRLLEVQLQAQIEQVEAKYQGARQRRSRHYQTPLGTVSLKRRVYGSPGGECRVEQELGLPADGWFSEVKELACALGVSSEFANANRLLERCSGVRVSEKTLANHVKRYGRELSEAEAAQSVDGVCPVVSSVTQAVVPAPKRPVLYIGADGIHTPLRQGKTREAKVGVMFWEADHLRLCQTRSILRRRDYVATLDGVESFRDQLNRCYAQTVQQRPHQVVFLGDGAAWIWLMASVLFPDAIQILDFFHVSEYLWEVARQGFSAPEDQKDWVEAQQQCLKLSQWQSVVQAAQRLPPALAELPDKVNRLVSYLTHNQDRIDYQRYLKQGLMIGSGVVESSNRRIVTVRLKQSGMFWSNNGAQAVMSLRAAYLSASSRWHDFWQKKTPNS
jgi:Uncharacterised protein family (UPF0236)